ncbi:GNAT family N-acetyltransferase [Bounagaea algeriensis]
MTEDSPGVRPATEADIPRAVSTLGRAFEHYPWTRHIISADRHLERLAEFNRLFIERIGLPHGRVWVVADGDAVAVWTTPETARAGDVFAELGPRFAELAGDRLQQQRAAEAAMAPHRPTEPAWFLGTVGVDPDRQGRGLGRAVIAPGIEAAAAEGVPAFLETSTESNVAFYERLGFAVTAEVDVPDGGPRTWAMLRSAEA